MVDPDAKLTKRHADDRDDNRPVADQRPVGENRNHRRQQARHRQEDDVDIRVAEQPEQMLPEQRVAAPRRVEERQSEGALDLEQDRAKHQRRKGHQHHHRGDQHVPARIGMRSSDMPGARILRIDTVISTASVSAEISTKVTPSSQMSALMPGV